MFIASQGMRTTVDLVTAASLDVAGACCRFAVGTPHRQYDALLSVQVLQNNHDSAHRRPCLCFFDGLLLLFFLRTTTFWLGSGCAGIYRPGGTAIFSRGKLNPAAVGRWQSMIGICAGFSDFSAHAFADGLAGLRGREVSLKGDDSSAHASFRCERIEAGRRTRTRKSCTSPPAVSSVVRVSPAGQVSERSIRIPLQPAWAWQVAKSLLPSSGIKGCLDSWPSTCPLAPRAVRSAQASRGTSGTRQSGLRSTCGGSRMRGLPFTCWQPLSIRLRDSWTGKA